MTRNQINYWQLQEDKRHNSATEVETNRHNLQTEKVDLGNLEETKRHNVAWESETNRHNLATEDLGYKNLAEVNRHNLVTEDLGYKNLAEVHRHNVRTEGQTDVSLGIQAGQLAETQRHNYATEGLTGVNLNILAGQLAESQRHNQAVENYTSGRYEAQNALDSARTQLTTIQSEWANVREALSARLTKSQIDQIDALIEKNAVEIDRLQSEITRNKFQNVQSVTRSINDLAGAFNSFSNGSKNVGALLSLLLAGG